MSRRYIRRRDEAAPVVAVGGLIGSGKTMLAEAVSRGLGLPVIASDRTRKWLAGVARRRPTVRQSRRRPSTRSSGGPLLILKSGRGVILDATFRERELRSRARELAQRHGQQFLFVETVCDDRVPESGCVSARPVRRCPTPPRISWLACAPSSSRSPSCQQGSTSSWTRPIRPRRWPKRFGQRWLGSAPRADPI